MCTARMPFIWQSTGLNLILKINSSNTTWMEMRFQPLDCRTDDIRATQTQHGAAHTMFRQSKRHRRKSGPMGFGYFPYLRRSRSYTEVGPTRILTALTPVIRRDENPFCRLRERKARVTATVTEAIVEDGVLGHV